MANHITDAPVRHTAAQVAATNPGLLRACPFPVPAPVFPVPVSAIYLPRSATHRAYLGINGIHEKKRFSAYTVNCDMKNQWYCPDMAVSR